RGTGRGAVDAHRGQDPEHGPLHLVDAGTGAVSVPRARPGGRPGRQRGRGGHAEPGQGGPVAAEGAHPAGGAGEPLGAVRGEREGGAMLSRPAGSACRARRKGPRKHATPVAPPASGNRTRPTINTWTASNSLSARPAPGRCRSTSSTATRTSSSARSCA